MRGDQCHDAHHCLEIGVVPSNPREFTSCGPIFRHHGEPRKGSQLLKSEGCEDHRVGGPKDMNSEVGPRDLITKSTDLDGGHSSVDGDGYSGHEGGVI